MKRELTLKQERFVQAYLVCGNAVEAYRGAYDCSRMKSTSVDRKAYEVLSNEKVKEVIQAERSATWQRNHIQIDELLSMIADFLKVDISEAFNEDGGMKNIHDIPKKLRLAISGLESLDFTVQGEKIGDIRKIKLGDKARYVDMLMKHLGAYDKHNQQLKNNVTIFQLPDNGR